MGEAGGRAGDGGGGGGRTPVKLLLVSLVFFHRDALNYLEFQVYTTVIFLRIMHI